MVGHYLKVAIRNLLRYRTQSLISMIGLAVGFVCFALSALWVRYEMTYDTFHEGAERIYLAGSSSISTGDGFSCNTSDLLSGHLKNNFPEVAEAGKVSSVRGNECVEYNGAGYTMRQIMADSCFISMLNIQTLDGDTRILLGKNEIAITDKAAKCIFGKESPIGKQLVFPSSDNVEKTIVAVVKSWKGHSTFSFDILLPYYAYDPDWCRLGCYTVFRTHPNCNIEPLRQKLLNIKVDTDISPSYSIAIPIVLLSELREKHPGPDVNVRLNHIRLFGYIGGLVILCGLCNYLTMLVTRIRIRKREMALRKVNGSSDGSLLILFLSEVVLLLGISLSIGVVLIELLLPTFKQLSGIHEASPFFYGEVLCYLLCLMAITVSISALVIRIISKQTLLESIHSKSVLHLSNWFYRGSILFQLIISIGFVFCTVVMMKQLDYLLHSKDLGLEKHNVGVIKPYGLQDVPLEKIVTQIPDVTNALYGWLSPIPKSSFMNTFLSDSELKNDREKAITVEQETLNQDYADFFHLELVEGRMLNEKDGKGVAVINETAVKALGWNRAVGKKVVTNEEYTIVGVIKDIYYLAPSFPVKPAIYLSPNEEERGRGDILFKVREGTWKSVVERLEAEIRKHNPDAQPQIINVEETFDGYMKSETTLSSLLRVISLVCIVIAVFGIFSLVTLSCEQRRKEIAIRKVNGASIGMILNLFFKGYAYLLVIASCVSFPLGYVIMKRWLEGYMKQTSIGFAMYAGIFIFMALVIFASIVWRVWKAARKNPAEVIKSE